MLLKDQVVIVTGGGRNIGRAISTRLAGQGAVVVIADLDMSAAQLTSESINKQGGQSRAIEVDVAKMEDLSHLVHETMKAYGKIDVLVNNAGVQLKKQALLELDESEWDYTMLVNAKSLCFLTKLVASVMKNQGNGKIVNMASVSGRIFSADNLAYTISKAAVTALTGQMAVELAPYGIRVNAVAPGYIDTIFNKETLARPNAREEISQKIPAGRLGTPDDISGPVLFLASNLSEYVTGHTLVIDGGYTLL
jgi:NAD(P)-dependent dehydrogenase (short-subunit alcohol dehydrogenase family)